MSRNRMLATLERRRRKIFATADTERASDSLGNMDSRKQKQTQPSWEE